MKQDRFLFRVAATLIVLALMLGSAGAQTGGGSVAGTKWAGTDSDGDKYTLTFEEDGTVSYTSGGESFHNGKWFQHGRSIYFHMNDHYSEYLGEIKGTRMRGKAWNTQGKTWTWEWKKRPSASKE